MKKITTKIPLIKIIEEQEDFSFNGRINILSRENSQLLGYILLKSGKLFHSTFKGKVGVNALCIAVTENSDLHRYIVEPEIVDEKSRNIFLDTSVVKYKCEKAFEEKLFFKDLKPPFDVNFKINAEELISSKQLDHREFDLLKIITNYHDIETIYKKSSFLEYETTAILIGLRKKSLILIYTVRA